MACCRPEREKIRPAREKWPKIGGLWLAGRVLYRVDPRMPSAGRVLYRVGPQGSEWGKLWTCRYQEGRLFGSRCPRGDLHGGRQNYCCASSATTYQPRTSSAREGEASHCLVPKEDTDTAATADAKRMRRSGSASSPRRGCFEGLYERKIAPA